MVNIKIILGSTRRGRFGEKPARWIYETVKKRPGVDAELLDLRDYPLPFFDEPASPSSVQGDYPNPIASQWAKKIGEADGIVIVTPEYNHGYPGVLKNALDYIYREWNRKPVGFVSYGGVAGARSVEQLLQVVIALQMVPIQSTLGIPSYWTLLDDKGNFNPASLEKRAKEFLDQLLFWTDVLKKGRQTI